MSNITPMIDPKDEADLKYAFAFSELRLLGCDVDMLKDKDLRFLLNLAESLRKLVDEHSQAVESSL